jgi:antitoxin component YwqK of YwqJK toxin-antitoxin module
MKVKISGVPGGILYRSKKDGIITKYYDNGKIKEEVPFELGAKNGIAKNYDEKGNITQIVYKFGKIVK